MLPPWWGGAGRRSIGIKHNMTQGQCDAVTKTPKSGSVDKIELPAGYAEMLTGLKSWVRDAQFRAQRVVNTQLIELYWNIGREILTQQEHQGWGSGVIARLATDLRAEFPQMKGFSPSNLQYMRGFAAAWNAEGSISQQAAGKLPWGHIMVLLDKLSNQDTRDWYAAASVEYGWSRNMLLNQIMNRTRERVGAAPSNFGQELAPADSDLAQQIAKDPYVSDFLDLSDRPVERDLEQALMDRIVDTLRELGSGDWDAAEFGCALLPGIGGARRVLTTG